jgi:hypothetical protein
VAYVAIAIGLLLLPCPFVFDLVGASRWFALGSGIAGVLLGTLYLRSPTWRIVVVPGDQALEVLRGGERRFLLPWAEVVRVVASPSTRTCFVDGGDPRRSLLVPGDGAPAPYDIEDKQRLYEIIMSRVPAERIREVALLQTAGAEADPDSDPEADPDSDSEAEAEADPEADPDSAPDPDPEADPEADPDPDPDSDREAGGRT